MTSTLRGKATRSPLNDMTKIRKQQIIDFIRQYREANGSISPTVREITVAIGYEPQSYGTVHTLIRSLIQEGWLDQPIKGARTLQLVEPPPAEHYYRREDAIRALQKEVKKTV